MRGGVGSLLRSSKHAAAWMGGRGMAQGHGMARGRMRFCCGGTAAAQSAVECTLENVDSGHAHVHESRIYGLRGAMSSVSRGDTQDNTVAVKATGAYVISQ